MTVRPIVVMGEEVLHRPAAPVTAFDGALRGLVRDMFDTMRAAPGVGLAAPQIGVDARVFVWSYGGLHPFDREYGPALGMTIPSPSSGAVINPHLELDWKGAELLPERLDLEREHEGCLSFPGYQYPIRRAPRAVLEGFDIDGGPIRIEAVAWLARIFQHEYGHLLGELYVDRLAGPWADEAAVQARIRGWGRPGVSWMPGSEG